MGSGALKPGMVARAAGLGMVKVLRVVPDGVFVEAYGITTLRMKLPFEALEAVGTATDPEPQRLDVDQGGSRARELTAERRPSERLSPSAEVVGSLVARRVVEALRFGVVPPAGIAELTLGYEQMTSWVRKQLPDANSGRPRVAEVAGAFGSGKSHTMAVVRHVAREHGYVTASVEVDGVAVSFSDPGGLLAQLLRTTRADGVESATPLLDLHTRASALCQEENPTALWYYPKIARNFRCVSLLHSAGLVEDFGDELNSILIQDKGSISPATLNQQIAQHLGYPFPSKIGFPIASTVAHRSQDFSETLLGYAAVAQLAGAKGLVVTIDEFEVEHNLPPSKFHRVLELLQVFGRTVATTRRCPLAVFVATVGQEGSLGDQIVDHLVGQCEGDTYVLKPKSGDDLVALGERLEREYEAAYGLVLESAGGDARHLFEHLQRRGNHGDGLIRSFIKAYVANLDARYGPPWSRT